jgi:hypothetical protein
MNSSTQRRLRKCENIKYDKNDQRRGRKRNVCVYLIKANKDWELLLRGKQGKCASTIFIYIFYIFRERRKGKILLKENINKILP